MKYNYLIVLTIALFAASCQKTPGNLYTVYQYDTVQTVTFLVDSISHIITLYPLAGDNTNQIDSAINFGNTHAGQWKVMPMPGNYTIKHGLKGQNIQNGAYHQYYLDLEGWANAKDAPGSVAVNWYFTDPASYGLGIDQCKGCTITNIAFYGPFTFPNALNEIQIDTLPWTQWSGQGCRNNQTSPTAGLAIDVHSDPRDYNGTTMQMYPEDSGLYIQGMSQSGSTDVTVEGCRFEQWVVGIVVSPAFQLNGDEIQINSCRVDQCASAISFTSSQNKACVVNNIMSWGQTNTVFDGIHFGAGRSDGQNPPQVITTSIAGNTCQIFDYMNLSFPLTANDIYADGVFRIGRVCSDAGNQITGAQIDFQAAGAGVPSPDYYWYGPFTTWTGCMLRIYNGSRNFGRIVLNSQGNIFTGGSVSDPPICKDSAAIRKQDQPGNYPAVFDGVFAQYTNAFLQGNGWDSTISLGSDSVTINPSAFTGSFRVPPSVGAGIAVADPITYCGFFSEYLMNTTYMWEIPMGWVTSVSTGSSQDTVYLRNTGYHCYSGKYSLFDQKLEAGY